jgi:hypothetical protein
MKFSRISITAKGVELDYVETDGDAKDETTHSNHMPPLGSFKDALQGFVSYVVDLIPCLAPISDDLTVTTLNLSEDKNGLRGLIVTALYPVEKAYNRPLVVNTPLVREGGELKLDEAFVLSEDVLKLIALSESEARRYKNKEYGEVVAAKPDSENTKNATDRMAAAEVASTKKPRGRGKRGASSEEPTPVRDLTDAAVRQLLASVDRDVPIEAIMQFSLEQRAETIRWAELRQKELVGQMEAVFMPVEPACVIAAATLPLKADEWTSDQPVRVTDSEAKEIVAAGRAD